MAEMNKDQVAAFAAQSAFFLLLSLFPLAMTLLTFVKYLPFTETQVLEIIKELFPEEINSNFEFMFAEIFDSKSSLLATTATILLTVWSASKGTMAIGRGLTFMAGKEDSVNYFLRRAIHTLYTLIFCVMLVAVMVIYILGDVVVSKMLVRLDSVERFQLVDTVANILSIVKIAFAPTVLFGVMIVAYWALPVERVRIKTAVPGAAFTTILWMLLSFGVSSYINIVGINTYMYGSLASVILLALWLYMCMYVMLIGAEINKFMDNGIRGIRRRAHKAGRKKRRLERKKKRVEKRRMRKNRHLKMDGKGKVIGNADADYREAGTFDPSRNQMMKQGRILKGKEYLTVFSGDTGEALHTIDYIPARGNVADWGDAKGNRSDRFLACVAYLDGVHPSVVMCRGYYTRTVLAAFDWNGKELKNRWVFDSNHPGCEQYAGQGNHNLRVGDVDGDGCDEIIYGSCAIDHNGKGLYSTRMGHGDAIHLTHFDPSRKGLQVWDCHENKRDGSTYRDAATGEVLLQIKSNTDVGRCMAADIDPTHPGVEMWSGDSQGIRNVKGEIIAPKMRNMPTNMAVWWDGDLLRELLDRSMIIKYDWENKKFVPLVKFTGTLFNNGTKSNPCLQGDIIGDWREEVLVRSEDNASLRLYVSTIPTEYRFHTFLEEPIYRISIATQNVGYNQPTQPGFYFGPDLIKMKGTFRGYQFK